MKETKTERSTIRCARFGFESGLVTDAIRAAVKGFQMPGGVEANLLEERDMASVLGDRTAGSPFNEPYCRHETMGKQQGGERQIYELIFSTAARTFRMFIPRLCAIELARNPERSSSYSRDI